MGDKEIILDGRGWSKTFSTSLFKMQQGGLLCDIDISCNDLGGDEPPSTLRAHACVLAASSPTLKEQLVNIPKGGKLNREIDGLGFGKTIWEYLLKFMYTSYIVLPYERKRYLKEIEDAALVLSIKSLIDAVTLVQTDSQNVPYILEEDMHEDATFLNQVESDAEETPRSSVKIEANIKIGDVRRSSRKRKKKWDDSFEGTPVKIYGNNLEIKQEISEVQELNEMERARHFSKRKPFDQKVENEPSLAISGDTADVTFECSKCATVFDDRKMLLRHAKICFVNKERILCDACSDTFETEKGREDHMRKQHGAPYLVCDICYDEFSATDAYVKHKKMYHSLQLSQAHKTPAFSLKVEGMQGSDGPVVIELGDVQELAPDDYEDMKDILVFDVEEDEGEDTDNKMGDYKCELCPKVFKVKNGLTLHQKLRHPDKYKSTEKCPQCPRTFPSERMKEDHLRIKHGAKPLTCNECQAEYRTSDALYRHRRVKHSVKSSREMRKITGFKCEECDLEFPNKTRLEDHNRKEHEAPPLLCKKCSVSFVAKDAHYRHTRMCLLTDEDDGGAVMKTEDSDQVEFQVDQNLTQEQKENLEKKFRCCEVCNYKATSASVLRQHMKKHSDEKSFQCNECPKYFKFEVGLRLHVTKCHPEKVDEAALHACDTCGKKFGREGDLADHMRMRHSAPLLSCDYCEKMFRTRDALYRHGRFKHPKLCQKKMKKIFTCSSCNFTTVSAAQLQNHMPSHTDARTWVCEICGATFKYKGDLSNHTRAKHEPPRPKKIVACEECGENFDNKKKLQRHFISRHVKEFQRTFPCEHCSVEFGSKTIRDDHIRIDHEGRPLFCEHCEINFLNADSWYHHKHTLHAGEQPTMVGDKFQCGICERLFNKLALLQRHEKYHVSVRPFKCDVCGRTFVDKADLKAHYKCHSDLKPFKCPFCDYCCSRKTALRSHMRMHTNSVLPCPRCEKAYTQLNGLKKHMRVHHGEEYTKPDTRELPENIQILEEVNLQIAGKLDGGSDAKTVVATEEQLQELLMQEGLLNSQSSTKVTPIHVEIQNANMVQAVQDNSTVTNKMETTAEVANAVSLEEFQTVQYADGSQAMLVLPEAGDEDNATEGEVVYAFCDPNENAVTETDIVDALPESSGQKVMYIKLGENQYIQIVDPSQIETTS